MKDKWTQQFQEKLDGYEMAAPKLEWTELDKALAKNRRPFMSLVWGRRIAAAAAVALLVIGGARVLLPGLEAGTEMAPQQNSGERWLAKQQKRPAVKEETPASTEKRATAKEKTPTAKEERLLAMVAAVNHEEKMETAKKEGAIREEPLETERNEIVNGNQSTSRSGDYQKRKSEIYHSHGSEKYRNLGSEKHNNSRRYHGGELMAAVYMQNAMTANDSPVMTGIFNSPMANSPYGAASEDFRAGSLDFLDASTPKEMHYDHDRPIKVGLSVKYNIDNRWSIVSGLTYSYLRSSFDYSEGKMSGSGVQKLHYVGLPLAASYNVISAKRLKVYLTAGGEMQKLVCGKATMEGVNIPDEDKKRDIREGGMQWSLNAAVGAEYNIVDNFGIYVEPGVSHYIDNKSSVENFYKYKPTNFSLNVGLRLSIR